MPRVCQGARRDESPTFRPARDEFAATAVYPAPAQISGAMAVIHRVLTVHAEIGMPAQRALLDAVERALHGQGVSRIWIDASATPDLLVLAEFEEE
jgi:hypothetical protein